MIHFYFCFQSACISGETRYILLTGEPSAEGDPRQNWRIGIETTSPDMSMFSFPRGFLDLFRVYSDHCLFSLQSQTSKTFLLMKNREVKSTSLRFCLSPEELVRGCCCSHILIRCKRCKSVKTCSLFDSSFLYKGPAQPPHRHSPFSVS